MMMDDYDGQMIFGGTWGLKHPDICLTGEEKPRNNLTQETSPDRESNKARCVTDACYRLPHSAGLNCTHVCMYIYIYILYCGPGSSSGKALRYGLDGPGSIPGVGGVEIFLRSFVSRLVLRSTQPPIK